VLLLTAPLTRGADLPLEADESDFDLGGTSGWAMKTQVKLSDTARLDGSTRLISTNWTGFHGGVVILLLDGDKNIVHRSSIKTGEVDGAWFSEKNVNKILWSEQIPDAVLEEVARIKVLHQRIENPGEWTETVADVARTGASLADVATTLGGALSSDVEVETSTQSQPKPKGQTGSQGETREQRPEGQQAPAKRRNRSESSQSSSNSDS
jgi:hypothetical protein